MALGWLGIAIAAIVLLLLVVFYLFILRRNSARGSPGLVTRSRLTCPKCGKTFDYDYLPGASVTAVRLGTGRYMACPVCHKWSTFELASTQVPATPRAP